MAKERGTDNVPAPVWVWTGIAAGIAGLVLLVVVESLPRPDAVARVIRYTPPRHTEYTVMRDSPGLAFALTPDVETLSKAFADYGYDLDRVRERRASVPRLRLSRLPRDLPEIPEAAVRKKFFFSIALPLILEANQRVAAQRELLMRVSRILDSGAPLPVELQIWLSRLADEYDMEPGRINNLLVRVDTIPVSLALAQAANESGWGTSRFALEGNAIFGQWTTAGGRGLVPRERDEGETHKVRSFDRLIDSAHAYLRNLNTHRAYRKFRAMRAEMRKAGKRLDGHALAGALLSYSELGKEYVALIRGMMSVNRLASLDSARLGDGIIGFGAGA